ncbi:uncharacterized protein B0H18DRAFT_956861 [Fomitopsis serialis]|uniref:uncharacterized protein n=1 Tax=Fomitopsis serialis TaxID=139415 RepID=UPI002007FC5D|nr:uncharacterized protein B0H18DRAFT_956861 [Neoantrodia serialis]KAH9920955.1 hypothetical protein B0H18DRAFT_956861 [Neoantrodia serialis]
MRAFNIIEHPTLGGEAASRKDYFAVFGIASAAATIAAATTVVALRATGTPIAAVIDAQPVHPAGQLHAALSGLWSGSQLSTTPNVSDRPNAPVYVLRARAD